MKEEHLEEKTLRRIAVALSCRKINSSSDFYLVRFFNLTFFPAGILYYYGREDCKVFIPVEYICTSVLFICLFLVFPSQNHPFFKWKAKILFWDGPICRAMEYLLKFAAFHTVYPSTKLSDKWEIHRPLISLDMKSEQIYCRNYRSVPISESLIGMLGAGMLQKLSQAHFGSFKARLLSLTTRFRVENCWLVSVEWWRSKAPVTPEFRSDLRGGSRNAEVKNRLSSVRSSKIDLLQLTGHSPH